MSPAARRRAYAPGRVNLIGDHTDHTGGLVLPMAIDRGTTVELEPGGDTVELTSDGDPEPARVPIGVSDPAAVDPPWARYVAGVVHEMAPAQGGRGTVRSTVPTGAGLSSSAALTVSLALALGFTGPPRVLAQLCQRAEQSAAGVPCGVMDQLASAAGVAGHALLIDCHNLTVEPLPIPLGVEVVVVPSGRTRALATSSYAERRAQCEAAEAFVGPLRLADTDDLRRIDDPRLVRRARHVITENQRVRETASHLRGGDAGRAGAAMVASHVSLRDDFEVSTPELDRLVDALLGRRGVHGARLTGGGFGGAAVALVEAADAAAVADEFGGMVVRASAGAALLSG